MTMKELNQSDNCKKNPSPPGNVLKVLRDEEWVLALCRFGVVGHGHGQGDDGRHVLGKKEDDVLVKSFHMPCGKSFTCWCRKCFIFSAVESMMKAVPLDEGLENLSWRAARTASQNLVLKKKEFKF